MAKVRGLLVDRQHLIDADVGGVGGDVGETGGCASLRRMRSQTDDDVYAVSTLAGPAGSSHDAKTSKSERQACGNGHVIVSERIAQNGNTSGPQCVREIGRKTLTAREDDALLAAGGA